MVQLNPPSTMEDDVDETLDSGNSADDDSSGSGPAASPADLIKEINESQGAALEKGGKKAPIGPKMKGAPGALDPADKTTGTDKTNPAGKTTDKTDGKTDGNKKDSQQSGKTTTKTLSRNDPAFVKGTTNDNTDDATEGADVKTDSAEVTHPEVTAYKRLSELTGGTIQDETSFVELVESYNELLAEKERGFEPQFKDDKTKKAHQLLTKLEGGQALDEVARLVSALRLQPDKMEPKSLLFEQYMLDPDNADLSREQGWSLFEEWFQETYSQDNQLTKRKLEVEAKKAKEKILTMQSEWLTKSSEEPDEQKQPEVNPDLIKSVTKAVNEFGGLEMGFDDNAADNELLRIAMDITTPEGQQELRDLQKYSQNPGEWWKDFVGQFKDQKTGNFDYQSFISEMYQVVNHKKIVREAFKHGQSVARVTKLNKARNSSDADKRKVDGGRIPAGSAGEKSFLETWGEAMPGS